MQHTDPSCQPGHREGTVRDKSKTSHRPNSDRHIPESPSLVVRLSHDQGMVSTTYRKRPLEIGNVLT
ncbi:hypothetical protein [Synechococcus sp. ROS8604]|uniref:hypothetical protein n=1 Tax=Synechococcus sp. ROS8604 TaxID=1442557 RepID=UPI001644A0CB|nr:hypothetical protein [Synechococcus sp. ROS8604]